MRIVKFGQMLVQIGLVLAIALLAIGEVLGQAQNQAGERGLNPGRSYAVSDIETIGLFSGNMMLNMPLGALPPGRGGMSAGIGLSYNSKLWDTLVSDVERFGVTHDKKTLVPSQEGGWRYNYNYYLKLDIRNLGDATGMCTSGVMDSFTAIKVQLITPDGAQHTMFPGSTGSIDADEFSNVYPDGTLQCDHVPVTSGQIVTFYSKDSSFLRLEVLTDSDTNWENNTWTLYMADGSKVAYDPNSTTREQITDRNGNYVQIVENATDSSYSNHRTTYLKDQLGRKVVIEYEADTNEDRIHSVGYNGASLVTRVTWKGISVDKTYFACEMAPSPLDQHAFENLALDQEFRVVDRIYLPTQVSGDQYYEFGYNADSTTSADDGWGEINEVKTPSGAITNYDYFYDGVSGSGIDAESVLLNRPTEKRLTYDLEYDGSSPSTTETWTYTPIATYDVLSNLSAVTVTGPNGAATTEYYTMDADNRGEVYKTVMPDGSMVEKVYAINSPTSTFAAGPKTNRYVKYEFMSIADSGGTPVKTAIKEYSQDKNGNTTSVKEYDYFPFSGTGSVPRDGYGNPTGLPSGASGNLKRITTAEFYNPTPDASSTTYNDADSYHLVSSKNLLRLVKSSEIQDGSAAPKSRSEITYDYTDYDSSNTKAGNPTETKVWDSYKGGTSQAYSNPLTTSNSITTSATYNSYGMPLRSTDANGIITQITYGNVSGPSGNVTDLYPTQTIVAYGTPLARTSTAVYDFTSGLVSSATDVDNDLTNATEYDALGRPTKSIAAQGTTLESWTTTEYYDVGRFVVVKSDLERKGDGKKVATQFYDQLGRVRLSKTLEDASTQSATNETDGIKVQTRYATTNSGGTGNTYQLTSNPYRADFSYNAGSETTMGWTRSKVLNTGRHSEVETFSGSALPQPFVSSGYNTASTGVVQTDVDANATTVTDQAGKVRRSITNGLGQLVRVDEPTSGGLGTVASPNQATTYAYDTLNNLTTVTQGAQTRTFAYSSLSRLLTAANPESGTISYGYDPNGNLTSKVDARSITTSYSYDHLNRVTQRSYSGGSITTPTVNYTYGLTAPAVGKLTKVSSSVSTTEYTGFDILGRVTAAKQTTDGGDSAGYTTGYTYNLSGALDTETYPTGRVVKNVLDANGDLSAVASKKTSTAQYWNYAGSLGYNAAGAVESVELGNGSWESTKFNSRLQPTQIALGTTNAATDLLKLNYTYGVVESGTLNTTKNNGNIQSQTITVPTVGSNTGFAAVQTYSYDELNRIHDAVENVTPTGGSSSQSWLQTFTFDRYGNRNFDEANTTTLPRNCGTSPNFMVCAADKKIYDPAINTGNNRLSTSDGYAFDNSGNTTGDAEGRTFVYDAENKQVEVKNSANYTIGRYYYDGDGKRVKKIAYDANGTETETTIFVYDAGGKSIAEYSDVVANSTDAEVAYLTADHLGSPRINTDENGAVTARHDYHPFGEEIATTQRTTGLNYSGDTIRKQFTGYERDPETDLDFAQARYYAKILGRFGNPDPMLSSGEIYEPQSWNRYVYVLNNPLRFFDPSGMFLWSPELGGPDTDDDLRKKLKNAKDAKEAQRIQSILDQRQSITNALSEARMSTYIGADVGTIQEAEELRNALDAYGQPGEDNGVTVGIAQPNTPGYGRIGGVTVVQGGRVLVGFPAYLLSASNPFLFAYVAHEGVHILQAKHWLEDDPLGLCGDLYDPNDYDSEVAAYGVMSTAVRGNKTASNSDIELSGVPPTRSPVAFLWKRSWQNMDYQSMTANREAEIQQHLKNIGRTPQNAESAFPGAAIIK